MSQPMGGTLVEAYLRLRRIKGGPRCRGAAVSPRCYYRPDDRSPGRPAGDDGRRHRSRRHHTARIAHGCAGRLRQGGGRHAATGHGRPPWSCRPRRRRRRRPRRRRRHRDDAVAGLALPAMPMAAALSATTLPPSCSRRRCAGSTRPRRDAAGDMALAALTERAEAAGSRCWPCLRGRATSTTTCGHSANASSGGTASSSHRRTSCDSSAGGGTAERVRRR